MQTCYLCGNGGLEVVRDKLRGGIHRKVLQCHSCGLNFLEPRASNLKEYYSQKYGEQYTPIEGKSLSPGELFEIQSPYQDERVGEIEHLLHPKMRVLDIGCSSGYFLHALGSRVHERVGMEFNLEQASFARDFLGIPIFSEPLEQAAFPDSHFDLITGYHLFEHIEDPLSFLAEIRRILKPEGHLVLEVPNIDNVLISQMKIPGYAFHWFRDPHVFNYSPQTLAKMLSRGGFIGETRVLARYGFLNHMHWKITEKRQSSLTEAEAVPKLVPGNSQAATTINSWIAKKDKDYRHLIKKAGTGSEILFMGCRSD